MEARIAFAKIALEQLRRHRELYREPLHFVTVSPMAYVAPFETASRTDIRSLQKLTGQALNGLSFVGAPDFALFKAWGDKGNRALHNHVGPHTHSVVFGASREQIANGMRRAGLGSGGWAGGIAYHIKKIEPDQLEGYLLYLLKAPLFHYHAKQGVRLFRHRDSGEEEHHSQFRAHPLRPGDQLRMAAVVHEMYVDELFFGQGGGTELVRETRNEAREPLRRFNEIADRQGRSSISLTVNVKPEARPLLSACIVEPIEPRLLRRLARLYPGMEGSKSNHHQLTVSKPFDSKPRTHYPELDDLDAD